MDDYLDERRDPLPYTWWIFDTEDGMDDLMDQAGDSLKKMIEDFKTQPFQDRNGNDRLFLARFEFPIDGKDFQNPDGAFYPKAIGFIDFLSGIPFECVEMLGMIGQYSENSGLKVKEASEGVAAAPIPDQFFQGIDDSRILVNLLYSTPLSVQRLAQNLEGEPKPQAHWWLRVNLSKSDDKFPVPGEFLALGVRMMPDQPWGSQKSSPFLYAGNWMDTVFYSSAVIKSIQEPTAGQSYSTYTVNWRGQEIAGVKPTDFAEYKVDDRVTILKDVTTDKQSQRWKDDDMKTFDTDKWVIAPITFYGGI